MAKDKTDSRNKEDIEKELKNTQNQIDSEKSSISVLESEIEALESLKTRIEAEKENIGYQKNHLDTWYTTATDWRGDCYNRYMERITELKTKYGYAYERVDTCLDEVCDEITRRKNQIEEHNGILGWLRSVKNELVNAWEKSRN